MQNLKGMILIVFNTYGLCGVSALLALLLVMRDSGAIARKRMVSKPSIYFIIEVNPLESACREKALNAESAEAQEFTELRDSSSA